MSARSLSPKVKALTILARREYSRTELSQKLNNYFPDLPLVELNEVLDDLEAQGYLSDVRFAESFVRQRSSRQGTKKIMYDLKSHQLNEDLLAKLSDHLEETEFDRALQVWQKKFKQLPQTPQEQAKQMRFLASRGFSAKVVYKIFNSSIDIDIE